MSLIAATRAEGGLVFFEVIPNSHYARKIFFKDFPNTGAISGQSKMCPIFAQLAQMAPMRVVAVTQFAGKYMLATISLIIPKLSLSLKPTKQG